MGFESVLTAGPMLLFRCIFWLIGFVLSLVFLHPIELFLMIALIWTIGHYESVWHTGLVWW